MAGGIVIEFAHFGDFDSFDILRSESPMDKLALPSPLVTGLTKMSYVDSAVVEGVRYYYRAAVWRDGVRLVSDEEAQILAVDNADPHWNSVVSLLSVVNGVVTEQSDISTHLWVKNGGAMVIDSSDTYLSPSTMSFSGGYLTSSTPLLLNNDENFTAEAFVKTNAGASGYNVPISFSGPTGRFSWFIRHNESLGALAVWDGTWRYIKSATYSIKSKWVHIAICKEGDTYYSFIDGVLVDQSKWTSGQVDFSTKTTVIASSTHTTATDGFNGRIEQVRITRGIARYTANFPALTKPFANY